MLTLKRPIFPRVIILGCFIIPLLALQTDRDDWVTTSIDTAVSVQFPTNPNRMTIPGGVAYGILAQEVLYTVVVLEKTPESETLASSKDFYAGVMDSMIKNASSILTDSAEFTVGLYKGMDFSYAATQPVAGMTITARTRALLVKGKGYCWGVTIYGKQSESSKLLVLKFLESFSLKK